MKDYVCSNCRDTFQCRDMESFSLCPECDNFEDDKEDWVNG